MKRVIELEGIRIADFFYMNAELRMIRGESARDSGIGGGSRRSVFFADSCLHTGGVAMTENAIRIGGRGHGADTAMFTVTKGTGHTP